MLYFVLLTISFTVAILLASGLALAIMFNPKVMKWYMKKTVKMMKDFENIAEELIDEEL